MDKEINDPNLNGFTASLFVNDAVPSHQEDDGHKGKPARKIKPSPVKNICRFPSTKSHKGNEAHHTKMILVESILEKDFCYHLDFNPDVIFYYPQPITFEIDDGNGGLVSYTPDFEAHYRSGEKAYIEVKPRERIKEDAYFEKLKKASLQMKSLGYAFFIVDDIAINQQPLLNNYKKLQRYKKGALPAIENVQALFENVLGAIRFEELITLGGNDLRLIYSAIAHGHIYFDMNAELLTVNTEVRYV